MQPQSRKTCRDLLPDCAQQARCGMDLRWKTHCNATCGLCLKQPPMPHDLKFCPYSLAHEEKDMSHYHTGRVDNRQATCGRFVGRMYDTLRAMEPGRRTAELARAYYNSQLAKVLQSARRHRVHPYFLGWQPHNLSRGYRDRHSRASQRRPAAQAIGRPSQHAAIEGGPADRRELVRARLAHWGVVQRTRFQDDHRIEKSKCDMLHFFEINRLPRPRVLGQFSTAPDASRSLLALGARSDASLFNAASWPIFVKACHITQGEMRSVRKINSAAELHATTHALACWLRAVYAMRADDRGRPWTRESNELTDTVAPGFVVQASTTAWRSPGGAVADSWAGTPARNSTVLEVKVEVFYGRAYLAVENSFKKIFIRDDPQLTVAAGNRTTDGSSSESPPRPYCLYTDRAGDGNEGVLSEDWYAGGGLWAQTEQSLSCAWSLAERTARAMGADIVRIDIFLLPSGSSCELNEVSLSSAMAYAAHEEYMARLWTDPELRHAADVNVLTGTAASKPVYLLDELV